MNNPSQTELETILDKYNKQKYNDAEKLIKSLLNKYHENIFCLKMLGLIYLKTDKTIDALDINKEIVNLSRNDFEAYNNLGLSQKKLNLIDQSIVSFNMCIKLNPQYSAGYYNLSNSLEMKALIDEAIEANRKAVNLSPDEPDLYIELAKKLYIKNRYDEANNIFNECKSLHPNYSNSYFEHSLLLMDISKYDHAEYEIKKALVLEPNNISYNFNYGILLMHTGRLDQAKSFFTQTILLEPNHSKAHLALSMTKKFTNEDEHFIQMKNLISITSSSKKDLCNLYFALAKAYEDLNDFSESYKYYKQANHIRKMEEKYSINKDKDIFRRLKKSHQSVMKKSLAHTEIKTCKHPIFIMGMPRSGTTLVEQIISNHRDVTAGGELPYIQRYGENIAMQRKIISKNALFEFRNNYLNKLIQISNNYSYITDKTTLNFRYISLISAALPEAKIVLVKRNAAATIWGNYKQCFVKKNRELNFTYSISDIIKYYQLYEQHIKYIEKDDLIKIFKVDYDRLTKYPSTEIKKIINFLQLDWDENCLSPHLNTTAVRTASTSQVRKKIYTNSSHQWKNFKPYLDGMLDIYDK